MSFILFLFWSVSRCIRCGHHWESGCHCQQFSASLLTHWPQERALAHSHTHSCPDITILLIQWQFNLMAQENSVFLHCAPATACTFFKWNSLDNRTVFHTLNLLEWQITSSEPLEKMNVLFNSCCSASFMQFFLVLPLKKKKRQQHLKQRKMQISFTTTWETCTLGPLCKRVIKGESSVEKTDATKFSSAAAAAAASDRNAGRHAQCRRHRESKKMQCRHINKKHTHR